jgi:hypothetical protein
VTWEKARISFKLARAAKKEQTAIREDVKSQVLKQELPIGDITYLEDQGEKEVQAYSDAALSMRQVR